jgi:hypothetical protein
LEDVHRVASAYLTRRNSTVGWFMPDGRGSVEQTNDH